MPWSAAAFILPGERIPEGEDIKNLYHEITSHSMDLWMTHPSTVMGKRSDSGVWNIYGKWMVVICMAFRLYHTRLFREDLHSFCSFAASSSACLDGRSVHSIFIILRQSGAIWRLTQQRFLLTSVLAGARWVTT